LQSREIEEKEGDRTNRKSQYTRHNGSGMKVHDPMCLTFVHGVLVGDGLVVAGEELHLTGTAAWEGRKEGREEDRN
jgi:hypothetical protein